MSEAEHKMADYAAATAAGSLLVVRRLAGGANIATGVYGTIITIAVIGAWYADPSSGSFETLLSVLATLLVFWVAHAYSHIVGSGLTQAHVVPAFKHDWPIVQSSFISLLILGLGALGIIEERYSLLVAIATSGILLAVFCLAMLRAAGKKWFQSLVLTVVMVALGIFIAVLEIKLG